MPFISCNGKRVLFIHIPKTGGTSVERWLSSKGPLQFRSPSAPPDARCSPQHFRMADFNQLFHSSFFDFAFTLVRNPYDRIESQFRDLMQSRQRAQRDLDGAPDFSRWLEDVMERVKGDPWLLDNHLRPQWEFIADGVEVSYFENGLLQVLEKVADRMGIAPPGEAPHVRRVEEGVPRVHWSRTDKLRVQEYYAQDFERFGYSRDGS